MAGRGPAPGANPNRKDPAQRRRRNKDPEVQELPREGHGGEFPKLPKTYRSRAMSEDGPMTVTVKFLKPTFDWYEAWGRSPMATQFTAVDWQRLQRLARLVDQYERYPDAKLLAEIRLQEASFGGTPMDRRRLGQKIAEPPSEDEQPTAPTPIKAARRRRLSAVK